MKWQNDRSKVEHMHLCWLIYRFFCATLVSLTAFWLRHCLVVYSYLTSSFIKISVSGAGERTPGSEVDRLLGIHPPLLLPGHLLPSAKKPVEGGGQRVWKEGKVGVGVFLKTKSCTHPNETLGVLFLYLFPFMLVFLKGWQPLASDEKNAQGIFY